MTNLNVYVVKAVLHFLYYDYKVVYTIFFRKESAHPMLYKLKCICISDRCQKMKQKDKVLHFVTPM